MAGSAQMADDSGRGATASLARDHRSPWREEASDRYGIPLAAWILLAVGVVAGFELWSRLALLKVDFGDADDALRMVQVRELLASGKWLDTTLSRIGGTDGMVSHWSRLLDLPLAVLVATASLVLPAAEAELVVRILWPIGLTAGLFLVVARSVDLTAGRTAALIALALLAASPLARLQFAPGRIDHHNVQNLAAVGAVVLLWLTGARPNAGRWAGIVAAVGIAVGYEALPIVLVATAVATVWGLIDREAAPSVRSYVVWLAGAFAVAFLSTTAPSVWGTVYCDAISINMVLLLGAGAVGVALALGRGTTWPAIRRWGAVIAGGVVGLALYAWSEPRCLAGPMGQTPAALKGVWLDHVPEAFSFFRFLAGEPQGGVAVALFLLIAASALVAIVWRHRRPADVFLLTTLALSLPLALWQMKYMPYVVILAIIPLAVGLGRLPAVGSLSAPTVRLAGLLLCNHYALMMLILQVPLAAVPAGETGAATLDQESAAVHGSPASCFRTEHLRALNALPQGLVFAPIDLGAHLLAETHHKILAAPYHRIGPQILLTHAVLSARDMDAVERQLRQIGARYVVICPALTNSITPLDGDDGSLDARLRRNAPPLFLEMETLPAGSPFRLWRVRGAAG